VDVVDVKPHSTIIEDGKQLKIIDEFIARGYKLKKEQVKQLLSVDIEMLSKKYKEDPISVKRIIKKTPTIGRVTYNNLVEFLSSYQVV
jgi:nucleoside diphosphate kinase